MEFPRIVGIFLMAGAVIVAAAQDSKPAPAPAPVSTPAYGDVIRPAADSLRETVNALRFEKWKGGNVREEANRDAGSILSDLDKTLPGLVKDADGAPERVGTVLPLARNLTALYDVALRVLDAARIAAPSDQATKIQDAVNILAAANKSVYDRMVSTAAAQDSRISDLQTKLKAQTEAAQAAAEQAKPVADCPAPPVKKAVRKKRAAAKSTTTQSTAPAAQKPQ